MNRPSRYIQNSNYATVKTYETITATLNIPNSVTVGTSGGDVVYSVAISLPTSKGLGWRIKILSSKSSFALPSNNATIEASASIQGSSFSTMIPIDVSRTSSSNLLARVVFPRQQYSVTYTGMQQTLTFKVQPYLSPFDS